MMSNNTHTKLTISRPITLSIPSSLFITLLIPILLVSSVIERHLNVCAFGPAYHNIASTSTSTTSSSGTAAASAIITTTTRIPSRISMMITTKDTNDGIDSSSNDDDDDGNLQLNLNFRSATLEDIPRCFEIESASYPSDEAATVSSLTSRQKHAGMYFILCYTTTTTTTTNTNDAKTKKQQQKHDHEHDHDHEHEQETIIGFVCGTRCTEFNEQSMSKQHNPSGKLLAIHSVVVEEQYRRKGIASKMMTQYVRDVVMTQREEEGMQRREEENDSEQQQQQSSLLLSQPVVESIVLIAKEHLLGFYVRCGFCVNRPSPIIHGKDLWYDIEMELLPTTTATATATVVAEVGSKEAAEDNDKDKKDGQDEEKDNPEEEKSNKGDNDQHEHHEPDSDVMNATRVLCGFICEVIVLVSLACGVIFNSLLLVVCDLLTINTAIDGVIVVGGEVKIEGYLGLYRADILAILEDLKDNSTTTMTTNSTDVVDNNMDDTQPRDAFFGCVYIDSIPGLEEDGVIDVAFNCARFCAVIGFAFGALLLFFVLFQQYSPYCGVPQSSQILMWSCGLVIQIFLALVYVIPYTWICDDNYCEYGIGLVWLVCAEFSWFIATIFTRCMRPGVRERRNRKAAAAAGEH
mmetsp:Transcript_19252/g.21526  ORF Transcript_19252/g.21526 Transcript_19252/m.21526 type:complete len:632 (+) Transcript_19252:276-2171(+)